ncbi:cation:H+ antiporter [Raineyella antarctica]|uniref:Cation:H+ antiporter n=1 Tax=Raineyella antarctica TaxID=1577474 RepID=A0A1G6IFA9_9ACTN|nr:calcium/sodium antiporter [Raineyella antarctica]SDC05237.1 cation:H+ antiporter [Raineyella antarctica]
MTIIALLGGLVALVAGAEGIVRYGTRLAERLGVSPLLVGLTVVSVGTSAPELAVGIQAMSRGEGSLVLGNLSGSNMVNLLLVLGLAAVFRPVVLQRQTLRLDLPAMVLSSVLVLLLSFDGALSRWEGLVLLAVAVGYTALLIRTARRQAGARVAMTVESGMAEVLPAPDPRAVAVDLVLLVIGIAVVVVGADWLVRGAVGIAVLFGVSESLIGLTVVAIGTSLPELATTISALIRHNHHIAVGNLIGSSTYNLTFVLGTSLLSGPGVVGLDPVLVRVDLPLMVAAVLLCIPVFVIGRRITRPEGVLFVVVYAGYLTYLIALRS